MFEDERIQCAGDVGGRGSYVDDGPRDAPAVAQRDSETGRLIRRLDTGLAQELATRGLHRLCLTPSCLRRMQASRVAVGTVGGSLELLTPLGHVLSLPKSELASAPLPQ